MITEPKAPKTAATELIVRAISASGDHAKLSRESFGCQSEVGGKSKPQWGQTISVVSMVPLHFGQKAIGAPVG